jgi:hypothetical protein
VTPPITAVLPRDLTPRSLILSPCHFLPACLPASLVARSLLMGTAEHTLGHLRAPLGWQQRLARFTENHDEQRALAVHRGGERGALAAAVVTYLAPGLRFFHDGQFHGRRQHHSMHVGA